MTKLICFVLLASFGAHASETYKMGSGLRSKLDAYNRAANLQPLDPSSTDELRVWTYAYLSGRIVGYVITESHAVICETTSRYTETSVIIEPARCHRFRRWHNNRKAIDAIGAVSAMNGKEWSCPMFDGGGVSIDAIRNSKQISLSVDNPAICDDQDTKAVIDLLDTLSRSK